MQIVQVKIMQDIDEIPGNLYEKYKKLKKDENYRDFIFMVLKNGLSETYCQERAYHVAYFLSKNKIKVKIEYF